MRFEAVLAAVYAAALDRALWPEAIVAVSDYVGATGGQLVYHDLRRPPASQNWMIIGRLRADLTDLYLQHYTNNAYARAIAPLPAGIVYSASEIADPALITRTAFHADILAPQRIADMLTVPYAAWQRGGTTGGFSLTLDRHGFDDLGRRRRRFEQVAPHLLRALDLGTTAAAADAARDSLFALVDATALPAMLLDAAGALAHANPAAEALLREGDGLLAGGRAAADARRLRASRPAESQLLAAAIGRAVAAAADPEAAAEAGSTFSVRIGRPSGRPDLAACAVPLPVRAASWSNPAGIRVALFVLQPARGGREAEARAAAGLGAVYGLTRAEQRVVALVGAGLGLPETARMLQVSPETARTHLRRCFAKTGTRSQVDLARLLTLFPAGNPR